MIPDGKAGVVQGSEVPPVSVLFFLLPTALPSAETGSMAGRSSAPLELQSAYEYWGALCAAARGLGGGEDGQVPPNPRACKETLSSPSGFCRFLKLCEDLGVPSLFFQICL